MGFPTTPTDCVACDVLVVNFDDIGVTSTGQCSLAGNAMHMPCVLAMLLIAAVYVEKVN